MKMYNSKSILTEGLEQGDLARLVHTNLHIDEFKSKMGDDPDIIVLSFKVGGKEPATDLMNFIERGYDWVLDADVSAGELDDGEYLVFVELERTPKAPDQIIKLISDMTNLTDQDLSEWRFKYRKKTAEFMLSDDDLRKIVPLTPRNYISKFGEEEDDIDLDAEDEKAEKELTAMKEVAGVPIHKSAPINDYTESIRIAAGLR